MVTITSRAFSKTTTGRQITAFDLKNDNGIRITILDFGGTVQSLIVPDRGGVPTDIALGYDDVPSYEKGTCYYGGIIGRCANRIGGGRFVLEGKAYQLVNNSEDGVNHNHGVFHQRVFDAAVENDTLVLRYFSADLEEGFPGNLNVEVRYRLTDDNALEIGYTATTDAPTVINLTNHSYFNLNGQDGSTVLNHRLRLNSGYYTEYTETFAQTGRIIPVEGTPLDFRREHTFGERIGDPYPQLSACTGYDHNMILDGKQGELRPIGTVASDRTGICLEAFTTEPAFQLYTGNFMDSDPVPHGKNGVRYPRQGGFCLEAQHYPDSINHPHFPSTVLRPGEVYTQKTVYRFNTEKGE